MNFLIKLKTMTLISSLLGITLLTGCSSNTNLVKEEGIAIERVNSSSANITRAHLETVGETLVLRGELTRRLSGHGPLAGHLHIELINIDSKVFKEANIGYKRRQFKSQRSIFYLEIPGSASGVKSLRVTHHTGSHNTDISKSFWQDVNQSK